jgi:hypothetical protein
MLKCIIIFGRRFAAWEFLEADQVFKQWRSQARR